MKVEVAYGRRGLEIALPDGMAATVIRPAFVPGLADPAGALAAALEAPMGSPPLRETVKRGDTVGIVFSDVTRPVPSRLLIPAIRAQLPHVPDERILLFNATGTHRANTPDELRQMLGDETAARYHIIQHDAANMTEHRLAGATSRGNAVYLDHRFLDCDARILTGFIEPHFFAGFSGGGKAVMPGLAALETVMHNHGAANVTDPRATWGITRGNPLWEDVWEAAALARPTFIVNVTLNRDKAITGVFAGAMSRAYEAGCAFVRETAMAPVDAPFDVVISTNSGYPLDLNVYQSVKGMSAAAQVVKPGGAIIMAAECSDGVPEHGEYGRLLREAASLDALYARVADPAFRRADMWQALVHARICRTAEVHFFSHLLPAETLSALHLTPVRDIAETLAALQARAGRPLSVCVLPEGPQTIPYVAAVADIP